MYKFCASLTLFCLSATCVFSLELNKKFIDYRQLGNARLMQRSSSAPFCQATGLTCGYNCLKVWACINNNGKLEALLVEECKNNQTCNNGKCSDTPSPACSPEAQVPFICNSEGSFPDPIDCRRYHICIRNPDATGFVDNARTCNPYGYNPGTGHCQNLLKKNQCPPDYPVPLCSSPGQTNTVSENDSMYYICALYQNSVLYPYQYLCPNGQIYHPGHMTCHPRPPPVTEIAP